LSYSDEGKMTLIETQSQKTKDQEPRTKSKTKDLRPKTFFAMSFIMLGIMTNRHSQSQSLDLVSIAEHTMVEAGFVIDLPAEVVKELERIKPDEVGEQKTSSRDLRSLIWSSIDDRKSKDLDQVEYAEKLANGDIRLSVGIADVDTFVRKDSAIDAQAGANSTSVYTGVKTFHMLPEELSTKLTSLVANADRTAIVTEITIDSSGEVKAQDVYQALVHNYAKLSYEAVGAWLDDKAQIPPEISAVAGMEKQVLLQFEAAKRLRELRIAQGALELDTIKATPVVDNDGRVVELAVTERNSARDIIENFMIAANVAMAE
jgi:ribonuclease R